MPESTYKSYFLGSLTAEAAGEIELRVVENADFAAELAVVEENLIEDYLDNSLSTDEKNLFRANYLNTEERIRNVEMTALVKRLARENANNTVEIDHSNSPEDEGFFNWFNSLGLGLRLAAASVVVILVMTSVWFVLRPKRNTELVALQNRYEMINQDPNAVGLDAKLSELTIVSGNLRASGSRAELSSTDLTENVRFRIALLPQTDNSASYSVIIFRDTTEVFRLRNLRPHVNSAGQELRLLLPREILATGNYRLNLQTNESPGLNYYFDVR